jgi:hypothetical protein
MRRIRCCLKVVKILKDQNLSTQTVKGVLPHRDLHPAGHMTVCSEERTKHGTEAFTEANTETGVSRVVVSHTYVPTFRRVLVPPSSGHIYGCIGGTCWVERYSYKSSSPFSTLIMEATCSSEDLVNYLPDYTVSLRGRSLPETLPR